MSKATGAGALFDLTGKVALITGASGGLGLHFAQCLARQGAHVLLAARRVEALEAAVAQIKGEGGSAAALALDVTSPASVEAAFAGLERLDILINNAGISGVASAIETSEEEWSRVISTNLDGVFRVAQQAARHMKASGAGGSIVNIASILGLRVAGGVAAYCASKAAVIQLTKALALEWARYGIRVNALCPGYIETDMNREFFASEAGKTQIKRIPQRRLGRPEELDGALLLMASAAGSYMTGATLAVDGGHLVSTL